MRLRSGRPLLALLLLVLGLVAIAETARQTGRHAERGDVPLPPRERMPIDWELTALPPADMPPGIARLASRGDEAVRVFVYLDEEPIGKLGQTAGAAERLARAASIRAVQDRVIPQIEKSGGRLLARMSHLSSGLAMSIPANSAPEIGKLPDVVGIV